ncbi:DUF4870 domain-containing protein [Candidatus Woesearchaeota archaeon]|nr:DUF4870 domain-containing protein [Candidatus Woesearchaeota archaeon]
MAKKGINESQIWAFLAYLLSIIGFILVFALKKNDRFAMYHAKQSLALFIVYIAGYIILLFIPIIGWAVLTVWWIFGLVLAIIGMINALTGKQKPLPITGKLAEKFTF